METLRIFEQDEDGIYYFLVNKRGVRVPDAVWDYCPKLQSGVFLATTDKVFTVLGDQIKNLVADQIFAIINFWVYYRRGSQKYIARLEPLGLKFRIKVETPVEDVGFLSHDGCVIWDGAEWIIYNYDFGTLIVDETLPDVQITKAKVYELLKKGFSERYLLHLVGNTDDISLKELLSCGKTFLAWEDANQDFHKVVVKLSELIDEYSADQIGSILGLKPYIVSVITQYLEIYNFVSSDDVV